ncbi:MAG: hypothetical protein WC644_00945 [Ignavibacteria bacterium]
MTERHERIYDNRRGKEIYKAQQTDFKTSKRFNMSNPRQRSGVFTNIDNPEVLPAAGRG